MNYFLSSETKRYKPTDLEEVIYLFIEKITSEAFLVEDVTAEFKQ